MFIFSLTQLQNMAAPWHPSALRRSWPGMSIAIIVALASSFISTNYGGPQLLYALFFGMAFHFLSQDAACRPGIHFCSKVLLRTGVALLGARITLGQVSTLGVASIAMILSAVLLTIMSGILLARWLKRPITEGLLSGGAVAICGASAALAIAAVLPATKENEKYTLLTVVGVTTLSTLAMITYPMLTNIIGLDETAAGIFIGGTIHDVAQVVGAGYLISNHAGDTATIVKLMRVATLVPVVVILAIIFNSKNSKTEINTQPLVPFFLIGFIWLLLMNSFNLIPATVTEWMNTASRACLVIAIAALGMNTSFRALATLGWRPVLMLVAESLWVALFVLATLCFIR